MPTAVPIRAEHCASAKLSCRTALAHPSPVWLSPKSVVRRRLTSQLNLAAQEQLVHVAGLNESSNSASSGPVQPGPTQAVKPSHLQRPPLAAEGVEAEPTGQSAVGSGVGIDVGIAVGCRVGVLGAGVGALADGALVGFGVGVGLQ